MPVVALGLIALLGPNARAEGANLPQLAFVDNARDLWIVGADGSRDRTIATASAPLGVGGAQLVDPDWSPDGRLAYAVTYLGRSELHVVNADGSGDNTVVSLPGGLITSVEWSPAGGRLAFVLWTPNPAGLVTWNSAGSRWDVYVVNLDGSGLRSVAPLHAGYVSAVDWSPDGKKLAFASDGGQGVTNIYTVGLDGVSLPMRVSPIDVLADQPRWSPDGDRLAFTGRRLLPASNLLEARRLWTMNADGSDVRSLNAWTSYPPSWSPDSQWLAYACTHTCGINIIRFDGGAERNLTPGWTRSGDSSDTWPEWSRHGEIAFLRDAGDCCSHTVWVMNGDGSNQHRVSRASSVIYGFSWSS